MKRLLLLALILSSVIAPLTITSPCSANSAEPPSIVIIVSNAPKDLEISLLPGNIKASRYNRVIESDFTFYRYDLKNSSQYTLQVTTNGKSFEVALPTLLQSYNNIFTLNLAAQTLTSGKSSFMSIILPSLRLIMTLAIEAIIFFLFGYRSRRSWITFTVVNVITQGVLNIVLIGNFNPWESYVVLSLIFGEFLVLIIEIVAFLLLIKEYNRLRTAAYVLIANTVSLFVGAYLITTLHI